MLRFGKKEFNLSEKRERQKPLSKRFLFIGVSDTHYFLTIYKSLKALGRVKLNARSENMDYAERGVWVGR